MFRLARESFVVHYHPQHRHAVQHICIRFPHLINHFDENVISKLTFGKFGALKGISILLQTIMEGVGSEYVHIGVDL